MPASGIVMRSSNADATRSVTVSTDGIVRLWNTQTKEKLASWRPPGSAGSRSSAINLLAVNVDASRVAVGCKDRRLLLWDPRAGDVAEASCLTDVVSQTKFVRTPFLRPKTADVCHGGSLTDVDSA